MIPDLEAKYRAVIEEYVIKGYARKLTPEEAAKRSRITWYLPHHPGFNVNKPNKCRVVFDAAAKSDEKKTVLRKVFSITKVNKSDGTSPNDQLYQGPDLANSLSASVKKKSPLQQTWKLCFNRSRFSQGRRRFEISLVER